MEIITQGQLAFQLSAFVDIVLLVKAKCAEENHFSLKHVCSLCGPPSGRRATARAVLPSSPQVLSYDDDGDVLVMVGAWMHVEG